MRSAQTIKSFVFILTACLLSSDLTAGSLSFHLLTAPIFVAFAFSGICFFFPKTPRVILQIIVTELVIFLCIADCYCQVNFGSSINPQLIKVVLDTNLREAGEFLSTFVGIGIFKQWRMILLIILLILFPISYIKKIDSCFCKILIINNICKIFFVITLAISIIFEIKPTIKFFEIFKSECKIQDVEWNLFRNESIQNTPVHRVVFAYRVNKLTERDFAEVKRCTLSANVDDCTHLSPHIVLVIGESYNKHHSSLYGYRLKTTPLQRKRMENGELILFDDVVTPWNITSNVFIEMFSRPLFPMLFLKAGYRVTFFSNQFVLKGLGKKKANQSGGHFLSDKALSDTIFDYRNQKSCKFDMELLQRFSKYRDENHYAKYTLDIIHLIGQHFEYEKRYPKNEMYFLENEYDETGLSDEAKQIVMHYDNATHYNDKVLDSLLTMFADDETIVIFVSDHGEEVFDDQQVKGRLFQKPDYSVARNEYEVPMWIWFSEKYRLSHPEIVEQVRESSDKPFITSNISQMLYHLSGISCEWYNSCRDILSLDYQCEPRIICGDTDYDDF